MIDDTASRSVEAPEGKLGVLLVGLGAVSTTFVAGVEAIRQGRAKPIGSVTQMNTIRLGKRTESRVPLVREFVPLAELDDLVFGAWDPIPDDAYKSAEVCGVLRPEAIAPSEEFLRSIQPIRQAVREEARRSQRQVREEQARSRRAAAAGHPRFSVGVRLRPDGDGLVCLDGDLPAAS